VSVFGGAVTNTTRGDKGLTMPLIETFKQAWADPDLRSRIIFIFGMFAVFVLGVNVPVPIPGVDQAKLAEVLKNNPFFQFANVLGGGALRRVSVFALGLNPYITSSIIIQILTTAFPQWKKDLQEGGEYARKEQNRRTRALMLLLCVAQGWGFLQAMQSAIPHTLTVTATTLVFWTAGAMFMLWLGEQISEKGIGNGVSLMIFAGIVLSIPGQGNQIYNDVQNGAINVFQALVLVLIFLGTAWIIVLFTTAQRRIPVQHMRRQVGTKIEGGRTSYLPIPINTAGVIPIIFAVSLLFIPQQFAGMFGNKYPAITDALRAAGDWLNPSSAYPKGLVGALVYALLIFFFTYFYTAIQYNVEDISNNLKRGGSFIPGVRPGKQTKDFLDQILSRVTIAGAAFLTIVALAQYIGPAIAHIPRTNLNIIGGTSLLIMVSVALETMRQIEANLLMKHYGS
jgi:preprotein translocase subunit SecY